MSSRSSKIIKKICITGVSIFLILVLIAALFPDEGRKLKTREESIPAHMVKMTPETDRHPPIVHNSSWNAAVPWNTSVNTRGAEDAAFMTSDGKKFFFFFTPDPSLAANKQVNDGVTGIWMSELNETGWSEPVRVFLGWDCLDGCPTFFNDTLWFCSIRDSDGPKMYIVEYKNGQWAQIQINPLPSHFKLGEMHITADGKEIYYAADRPGGKGNYDLWVTRNVGGTWQEPELCEGVNTAEYENQPYVTPDGNELWFTRVYQGTPAIFRSFRNATGWSTPELIISQFAGEPTLDPQGNIYFTHHFYVDGVMKEADIYVAYKK